MMRIALVAALVTAAARPTAAGPWCGGGAGWSPLAQQLPKHPRLVFWVGAHYYAGRRAKPEQMENGPGVEKLKIRATLDGKPVQLAVKDVAAGTYTLREVEVKSDNTGKLVIGFGDEPAFADVRAEYDIVADWTPPTAATGKVTRYVHRVISERPGPLPKRHGAAIELDVPAIELAVKWRRDDKDRWRSFAVPALAARGHAVAEVGEMLCDAATIPVELMERGVQLELTARLPDGKSLPIALPSPFVVPAGAPHADDPLAE